MELQTYASKSTAIRGARRSGIKDPKVEQTESGRWVIKKRTERRATGEPTPKLQPIPALPGVPDLSEPEAIVPKRTGIAETYNDLAAIAPARSMIRTTWIFIWTFLDNCPDGLGRKEAISLLVKNGININTARTQYQLWWASKKRE